MSSGSSPMSRTASVRAASTIFIFLMASIPRSVMPHCLVPESSPAPRKVRSSSANSKPFLAVLSAFSLAIVFSLLASAKM